MHGVWRSGHVGFDLECGGGRNWQLPERRVGVGRPFLVDRGRQLDRCELFAEARFDEVGVSGRQRVLGGSIVDFGRGLNLGHSFPQEGRSRCLRPRQSDERALVSGRQHGGASAREIANHYAKRWTHSLFRQGCLLYDLTPNKPDQRLRPLVTRYDELLKQNRLFVQTFGPV
jgi:hypothetical protein